MVSPAFSTDKRLLTPAQPGEPLPISELIPVERSFLRPWQFCNLSTVIARPNDDFKELERKVELATIIGTIQFLATHFPGLRPQWKQNCEEEAVGGEHYRTTRLPSSPSPGYIGTSQAHSDDNQLCYCAVARNQFFTAITCVKPSRNSAHLYDCFPVFTKGGPVSIFATSELAHTHLSTKYLRDAGVPMDP